LRGSARAPAEIFAVENFFVLEKNPPAKADFSIMVFSLVSCFTFGEYAIIGALASF
jgi:hypothetical protein